MAQMTEVHSAGMAEHLHPADFIKEIVPRSVLTSVFNALAVGARKHGVWDSSNFSLDEELEHIENHLARLRAGETHDEDDGHSHASALAVRAMKIDDLCRNG